MHGQTLSALPIGLRGSSRMNASRFPSPLYLAATTKAEALAEAFLREGAGCLWSAVREVVRALEYEADPRDIATGLVFRLGLYSKGGITGITRQYWRHVAASRLLNALVALTLDTHRWNAISVNMDNATAVHVDGRNAAEKSLLIGLSHHRGGGLWIQDNAGTEPKEAGGVCYRGVVYPTAARAVQFDGRTWQYAVGRSPMRTDCLYSQCKWA